MLTDQKLRQILVKARYESYVRKSKENNPYTKAFIYDWEFKTGVEDYIYTDSYRGFNPYGGVEYIYKNGVDLPIWSCDYVGYVKRIPDITPGELYGFLKESRAAHLSVPSEELFSDFKHQKGYLRYESVFEGDIYSLLQKENFYFLNELVAQQITAGRVRQL